MTHYGRYGTSADYSRFEADGTLEFNGEAIVWKDINVGGAILPAAIGLQPDRDEFVDQNGVDTSIETYAIGVNEGIDGSFEIQHDYKEGTDIYFHLHWQGIDSPTGTDKVHWNLIYTISTNGNVLTSSTSISAETDFDTQYSFVRTAFDAIDGININIGDQFLFRIQRIDATADEYAGDALIATVGIHYQVDTVGSRQVVTK